MKLPKLKDRMALKETVIKLAVSLGWKFIGLNRKDRTYKTFRRGNKYVWIGNWYIERSDWVHAIGFPEESMDTIKRFLE